MDKKFYSFIRLTHIWKIYNINNIATSNKFENSKLTLGDIIDFGPKEGGINDIPKYQFLYKYQIIDTNLVYTENYFKNFKTNKVYRIPLIMETNFKLYIKKKYKIEDFNKYNFEKGDRLNIEFEDSNYKKIIKTDYIKAKWEELKLKIFY